MTREVIITLSEDSEGAIDINFDLGKDFERSENKSDMIYTLAASLFKSVEDMLKTMEECIEKGDECVNDL
jgi:hypothetical protein